MGSCKCEIKICFTPKRSCDRVCWRGKMHPSSIVCLEKFAIVVQVHQTMLGISTTTADSQSKTSKWPFLALRFVFKCKKGMCVVPRCVCFPAKKGPSGVLPGRKISDEARRKSTLRPKTGRRTGNPYLHFFYLEPATKQKKHIFLRDREPKKHYLGKLTNKTTHKRNTSPWNLTNKKKGNKKQQKSTTETPKIKLAPSGQSQNLPDPTP